MKIRLTEDFAPVVIESRRQWNILRSKENNCKLKIHKELKYYANIHTEIQYNNFRNYHNVPNKDAQI
jgi:hypothetical protein